MRVDVFNPLVQFIVLSNMIRADAPIEFIAQAAICAAKDFYATKGPNTGALRPVNFDTFDDHMELLYPDWRAQCARKIEATERERLAQRTAIIASYGSIDRAVALCDREKWVIEAVMPWRSSALGPLQRTQHIVGLEQDLISQSDPALINAITKAFPMPDTIDKAIDEHRYWEERDNELRIVLNTGIDSALDVAAQERWNLTRLLINNNNLRSRNINELSERFTFFVNQKFWSTGIPMALFEDLRHLLLQCKPEGIEEDFKIELQKASRSGRRSHL